MSRKDVLRCICCLTSDVISCSEIWDTATDTVCHPIMPMKDHSAIPEVAYMQNESGSGSLCYLIVSSFNLLLVCPATALILSLLMRPLNYFTTLHLSPVYPNHSLGCCSIVRYSATGMSMQKQGHTFFFVNFSDSIFCRMKFLEYPVIPFLGMCGI